MGDEKFWITDPCVLFKPVIFPTSNMSRNEKLNALTRLSILIAIVMYALEYKHWFTFLILALLIFVLIRFLGREPKDHDVEGFTMTPTYSSTDFNQTIVSPTFSEEWQSPPPAYDIYTNVPTPDSFEFPIKPQNYPYGQVLSRTNLLPNDEYMTHMLNGSSNYAREYVNNAWTRHELAFRDNMSRILKKKLERRFRQTSCNDSFSPYNSY